MKSTIISIAFAVFGLFTIYGQLPISTLMNIREFTLLMLCVMIIMRVVERVATLPYAFS